MEVPPPPTVAITYERVRSWMRFCRLGVLGRWAGWRCGWTPTVVRWARLGGRGGLRGLGRVQVGVSWWMGLGGWEDGRFLRGRVGVGVGVGGDAGLLGREGGA